MQLILDNIHRQYPTISSRIDVTYPAADILLKGAMSHYVTQVFDIPIHQVNYHNARFTHIQESQHYPAMRTLIMHNVISTQTKPHDQISRADFITQVVKAYALDKRVVIQNTAHDIADLDNQDQNSAIIVYAYDQGWLDYILIRTRGQIFLDPDAMIHKDEVYEILTAISEKHFVTGIITAQSTIQQDQIAQAIVDAFAINIIDIPTPQPIQNPNNPRISIVQRVREIIGQL